MPKRSATINTAQLLKYLEDLETAMVDEEIDMWLHAGYYIRLEDDHYDACLTTSEGEELDIESEVAVFLRNLAIGKWNELKKRPAVEVRVVEIDPLRESLEARNG